MSKDGPGGRGSGVEAASGVNGSYYARRKQFERRAIIEWPIRRGAKEASDHPRDFDIRVVQERAVPVKLNSRSHTMREVRRSGARAADAERVG
jgi:hypothetical protein